MSLYAAIDLHSSNSVLAVMGGDGKALLQCRRPYALPRLLWLTWRPIGTTGSAWRWSRPATGTGWSMG
ncbi:hypothetical protein [Metallibacterium sp.]|uniref:hypothetical protein n=1 Tax=Metallibacterium sp. TaxID=2940281 RepID=UPI00262E5F48|nr:hypothetical protein [Metallibacterium sp.]